MTPVERKTPPPQERQAGPGESLGRGGATVTRAQLERLVGRRLGAHLRRYPALGPRDRRTRRDREPTMSPTRGLTPAITCPGPKTYTHHEPGRVAVASWNDDRSRVPVQWLTTEEWRTRR